jgi:hypothetical protein
MRWTRWAPVATWLCAVSLGCNSGGSDDDGGGPEGGRGGSPSGGTGGQGQPSAGKGGGGSGGTGTANPGGTSGALTWSPEVLVDEDQYATSSPSLAMDADGNTWVAWIREGEEHEVRVRHYSATHDSWGPEQPLVAPTGILRSLAMSGRPNGDVVLAWQLEQTPATRSIQVATYSASDEAWTDAVELARIEGAEDHAICVATGADGVAAIAWIEQELEHVRNDSDFITHTLIKSALQVSFADGSGGWSDATTAWQGEVSKTGYYEVIPGSAVVPASAVKLILTGATAAWALVGTDQGIHVASATEGSWGDTVILDDTGTRFVQAAPLANGTIQGAWVTNGDVMVSELAPGESEWSVPERIEKISPAAASLTLATGVDGSPTEAALTWNTGGGIDSNSRAYVTTRSNGAWAEPTQFDGIGSGMPRVGIAGNGETIVVSGGVGFWWAQSAAGEPWSPSIKYVPAEQNVTPRAIELAVAPSRVLVAVWVDRGNDPDLLDHLLTMVAR